MTVCTCGATAKDTEADEAEDVKVEADTSEALEEPVLEEDVDKEDDLVKDLEDTLLKLKEVLAYLEEMGGADEKAEDEEELEEEEDEEPAEEEEEEEKSEPAPAEKVEDLEKALGVLKTHGINIYAGKKRTPATKPRSTPKPTNWTEFSKSLEDIDLLVERAGGN